MKKADIPPGTKHVLGFYVIDGGRAGKPCSVYALRKAHAWHGHPDSEMAKLCTNPYPPGIDLSIYRNRLVTVRLAWALTLHCLGSSHGRGQRTRKLQPVRGQDCREPSKPLLFRRHGLVWGRWREIERLVAG